MSTDVDLPAGSHDPARQEGAQLVDVDWESLEEGRTRFGRRRLLRWALVAGYLGLWGYDVWLVPARDSLLSFSIPLPWLGSVSTGLAPTNVDWLFGLTLLVAGQFVATGLARNPRLRAYYWAQIRKNRVAMASLWYLAIVFVLGLLGPTILGQPELDVTAIHEPPLGFGGSLAHPLGTADGGEGILEIVLAGMRVSMQVALIATTVSIVLATAVGASAALAGGWIDELLMRGVDLLLTFPTFFLIVFLVYLYGGDLFVLVLILALTGWGATARMVRSEALQRTTETYVRAAEAAGASRWYVVRRHVVPNVSNTIVTAVTLLIPAMILTEAVIAFLGFGDPDVWSWGRVIASGRGDLQHAWWVSTIPGLFLFTTVLAFNFLGDALRDALDPRHHPHTRR